MQERIRRIFERYMTEYEEYLKRVLFAEERRMTYG
jgi:hypothetical protein